jgi:3-isopropylmalate dehydratase small subunit
MQPFITHTGKVAPLDKGNVETDQIATLSSRPERPGFFLRSVCERRAA